MVRLEELSISDGLAIYEMLQEIPAEENGFLNEASGKNFEEFKMWLKKSEAATRVENIPAYFVPQTVYWLYDDDIPIGVGKIRSYLNPNLLNLGGHIGYGIRPTMRGKGYGNELLRLLLIKAKDFEISNVLITVEITNTSSQKVVIKNGGVKEKISNGHMYFWVDLS